MAATTAADSRSSHRWRHSWIRAAQCSSIPSKYGYRLFCRTFEEHRQALTQPSWKYILNYETEWMSRDQIVDSTYEAGLRLNRLKARYGLADPRQAAVTEERILRARRLIAQIDDIMSIEDESRREQTVDGYEATGRRCEPVHRV